MLFFMYRDVDYVNYIFSCDPSSFHLELHANSLECINERQMMRRKIY